MCLTYLRPQRLVPAWETGDTSQGCVKESVLYESKAAIRSSCVGKHTSGIYQKLRAPLRVSLVQLLYYIDEKTAWREELTCPLPLSRYDCFCSLLCARMNAFHSLFHFILAITLKGKAEA